jgi:amino acid permease
MIAETVSLGVLSLPSVLATLGLFPGVFLILLIGLLATYTGYAIYQFKLENFETKTMAHGMEIIFGRWGRWVAEVGQDLELVFIMAAHLVLFSIAFNELTNHAICTVAFMGIGTVLSFLVSLPRTLKGNSYFSALCKSSSPPSLFLHSLTKFQPAYP